jgi:hypothetical protein
MEKGLFKKAILIIALLLSAITVFSQQKSIKDLEFLVGEWEVREENNEKTWWEQSTRIGRYVMDSTYIELVSNATSSNGKKRTYRWYIHYNKKEERFEMVSMFSNWHKIQFDILHWDLEQRKLSISNGDELNTNEYHERYGELVFNENFSEYVWKGQNKYGNPDTPSIWKYVEKGTRIK